MSLTLYYHPLSSFCHKVLIALYENATPFQTRIIDLGAQADRDELHALWPFNKFPVIRDHQRNRDVAESTLIIEYLDRYFPGKRALLPNDWEQALQVRLWDRICDNYVQTPMQNVVGNHLRGANADLSGSMETLKTAYQIIDSQLRDKTWIAGQEFSMADCAAAPALFYAGTIQPFDDCRNLLAYFERLTNRPSVKRVIDEAKPYFKFYPFADAIPQRFR